MTSLELTECAVEHVFSFGCTGLFMSKKRRMSMDDEG